MPLVSMRRPSRNSAMPLMRQAGMQAGYTPSATAARIISTPSDVYMFSRLPEADQKAILRQAANRTLARMTAAEERRYLRAVTDP